MDFQQLWLMIISILISLFSITYSRSPGSRTARKCRRMDITCFTKGRAEIDELFHASETTYTPLFDVERFKNIEISTLQRYMYDDRCMWQSGNMYNSTCPHHYVLNRDSNRKPEIIIEAGCNCHKNQPCLDGIEGSQCMPVKYFAPVLRYNGHRHKCATFRYSQTIEEITVGCTCTYPKLDHDHMEPHHVLPL